MPQKSHETSEIDFTPAFDGYPPTISTYLMRIAAAHAAIEEARILPAQEDILRASALAETVHYSNLLEGNQLSQIEARRALRGELDRLGRAEIELVNYVEALDFIDSAVRNNTLRYDEATLLTIHGLITRSLGRDDANFRPRHEGAWRDGIAFIPDGRGSVDHFGASPAEAPLRMRGALSFLERRHNKPDYPGAVLAAIAHHVITDIHPFADGNGRVARAMAFAVLRREQVLTRRLFSPDRHYALDKPAYIKALRSSKRPGALTDQWSAPGNLNQWLLYYTESLALEFERMALRVRALNAIAERAAPIQLSKTQEHMVSVLSAGELRNISRVEYEAHENVSEPRARSEIQELVNGKVLESIGAGASTRYRLVSSQPRPTTWNNERVESELKTFLEGHATWPTRAAFAEAGLNNLYQAMSKRGGVASWAKRMGYSTPGKGPRRA